MPAAPSIAPPPRPRLPRWAGSALAGTWERVRRLRPDRIASAAALLAGVVLVLVETALASGAYAVALPLAFGLAVVHAGGVPLATRVPNVAAALSLAAALALQILSERSAVIWPWWPVMIVTQSLLLAAVAARTTLRTAALHWMIALGASVTLASVLRPGRDDVVATDLVVFGAVSAGLILGALLTAQWRHVRTELMHERRVAAEESEARALMEERARIARELHDVVAHSLSIITVQSATARFRHPDLGEPAVLELERIGAQSRQALDEMRGLLRVLRASGDATDLHPQPGLAEVPALVAGAGGAGAVVTLAVPPGEWARDVPPLSGLAAYRIVQEATSNALRHAPGAAVEVTLGLARGGVSVVVRNTPPLRVPAAAPGTGHGLTGMRERAEGVGGRLDAGPTPDGGWAVEALLPAHGAEPGRKP